MPSFERLMNILGLIFVYANNSMLNMFRIILGSHKWLSREFNNSLNGVEEFNSICT